MFTREPIRMINDVHDFIGRRKNSYLRSYEQLSRDRRDVISLETSVLRNLLQVVTTESIPNRLLDVGCGSGYILKSAKAREKVALDVSIGELFAIDFEVVKVRAHAEKMPFEDGYFDCVVCFDLLEHVLDERQLVSELSRVLEVGKPLYLACPFEQDLSVYETDEYKHEFKQYEFKHRRSIGWGTIYELFSNFEVVNSTMITAGMKHMRFKPYAILFAKMKMITPG